MNKLTLVDNEGCFGCGADNPVSLGLRFVRDGDTNRGQFTPRPKHQGYTGITHGGILAAVMDEAMAWVLWDQGLAVVAGRMEVRYRRPALIGHELTVEGWVQKRRARHFVCESRLKDASGETVAEADATFVMLNERAGR